MGREAGPDDAMVVAQMRKGVAPYCALALLAVRHRYGYELARDLAEAGVVAGAGSVYPLLSRLQDQGWVTAEWRPPGPDHDLPRKYYALTAGGRAALAAFRQRWPAFVAQISTLLRTGGVEAKDADGS